MVNNDYENNHFSHRDQEKKHIKTHYDPGGFVVIWIVMMVSGILIYFGIREAFPLAIIGMFFIGVGILAHIFFFRDKFAPKKEIQARLIAIDKGGKYVDFSGDYLYVLEFQDGNGKSYYYPTNDVGNLEVNNFYMVTAKRKIIIKVN